jgi:hypothetical protein
MTDQIFEEPPDLVDLTIGPALSASDAVTGNEPMLNRMLTTADISETWNGLGQSNFPGESFDARRTIPEPSAYIALASIERFVRPVLKYSTTEYCQISKTAIIDLRCVSDAGPAEYLAARDARIADDQFAGNHAADNVPAANIRIFYPAVADNAVADNAAGDLAASYFRQPYAGLFLDKTRPIEERPFAHFADVEDTTVSVPVAKIGEVVH